MVQGLLGTLLGFIVQNLVVIIFGCAVSFYFSWKLTLVMLSMSPLLGFCAVTDYFGYMVCL
jgi:ABC-type bacteriocin/lantibiotic exporter with double-glycine peptidase domain